MRRTLLQACLNGARQPGEHPALPRSPEALAIEARRAVDAGAGALHIHPRDADGAEALEADSVGSALSAVRAACPGVPVGISTGAWIEPELERRLALVRGWEQLPDFASVNLSEEGAAEVCSALIGAGIGVEAGLWTPEDAGLLLELGLAERCVRLLIELVRERTAEEALVTAGAIERVLARAGVATPRLLHGEGAVTWPMLEYALDRGYDIRIGLEDTLLLPGGSPARDNAELVSVARAAALQAGRRREPAHDIGQEP